MFIMRNSWEIFIFNQNETKTMPQKNNDEKKAKNHRVQSSMVNIYIFNCSRIHCNRFHIPSSFIIIIEMMMMMIMMIIDQKFTFLWPCYWKIFVDKRVAVADFFIHNDTIEWKKFFKIVHVFCTCFSSIKYNFWMDE